MLSTKWSSKNHNCLERVMPTCTDSATWNSSNYILMHRRTGLIFQVVTCRLQLLGKSSQLSVCSSHIVTCEWKPKLIWEKHGKQQMVKLSVSKKIYQTRVLPKVWTSEKEMCTTLSPMQDPVSALDEKWGRESQNNCLSVFLWLELIRCEFVFFIQRENDLILSILIW